MTRQSAKATVIQQLYAWHHATNTKRVARALGISMEDLNKHLADTQAAHAKWTNFQMRTRIMECVCVSVLTLVTTVALQYPKINWWSVGVEAVVLAGAAVRALI